MKNFETYISIQFSMKAYFLRQEIFISFSKCFRQWVLAVVFEKCGKLPNPNVQLYKVNIDIKLISKYMHVKSFNICAKIFLLLKVCKPVKLIAFCRYSIYASLMALSRYHYSR